MKEMKTTHDRNDVSSARQRRETIATRTEQAIDDLLTQLAQPGRSLLPTLTLMSRFRRYSLSNQLLILAQCPHATDVRGYRTWQRAGYQVRKGEHGIAIWAPTTRRTKDVSNATTPTHVEPVSSGDDPDSEATNTRPRFRIAYVWDISSCEPVSTTASTTATVSSAATTEFATGALPDAAAAVHLATLTAVIAPRFPIAVLPLRTSLYGYTDGASITLNAHHDAATRCATLVHEYTHACLHFGAERPDLTTRETEAEGVAFIVCQALGIPVPTSIDYIRAYRGTPTTLRDSLIRIRELANALVQAVLPADDASAAES